MRIHAIAMAAASALGLALAFPGPASAQQAGPGYYGEGSTEVIVIGPRIRSDHNRINVPIETATQSLPVSYADLDLRTSEGAHALHVRVRQAAAQVCAELRASFPAAETGNPHCYRNAVADAVPNIDAAIGAARGYYGGY